MTTERSDAATVAEKRSHKKLNPEIKALRAIVRGVEALPPDARQRGLEWLVACYCDLPGVRLPKVKT